jgi:squalene-hopene/tetraprenyl-beta-curcumene cyclase
MWALQETIGELRGSWSWLEFGHDEPWEADDSRYYGTCLAAIAVGAAPENYRSSAHIEANLSLIREYLRREYSQQSTMNRIVLLWASTKLPGLLESQQSKAIIDEVFSKQQSDGGWQLAPLSWRWRGWTLASFGRLWLRSDGSLPERNSDGYATGLIALVVQEAGVPPDNPHLRKALAWLERSQREEGNWPSDSVNKRRNPSSNVGRFMSDAATAYAVLALTDNDSKNDAALKRDYLNSQMKKSQ